MSAATARRQVTPGRRAMLAKVHLGAKELGLRDDERRDVLERLTGRRSSADCSDAQLDLVLAHYRGLGWKPGQPAASPARPERPRRTPATSPVAVKARALWISLWHLGVVRDSSEAALEAFGRRQLGVDRLQWADAAKAHRLIEALKAMATREGWNQAPLKADDETEVHALKRSLIDAQWARLKKLKAVTYAGGCESHLNRMGKIKWCGGLLVVPEPELDASISYLGGWIRRAQHDREAGK